MIQVMRVWLGGGDDGSNEDLEQGGKFNGTEDDSDESETDKTTEMII